MIRRRFEAIDNRAGEIVTELNDVRKGEAAAKTIIPTEGEIDHDVWLGAELDELTEERKNMMRVVSVEEASR